MLCVMTYLYITERKFYIRGVTYNEALINMFVNGLRVRKSVMDHLQMYKEFKINRVVYYEPSIRLHILIIRPTARHYIHSGYIVFNIFDKDKISV